MSTEKKAKDKILFQVRAEPNEDGRTFTVKESDFEMTSAEWLKLGNEEKKKMAQNYLNDMHEQPYWVVDEIYENH